MLRTRLCIQRLCTIALRTTALLRRLYIKALCRASCRALCRASYRASCRASAELRAEPLYVEPPYIELSAELGAEPLYAELCVEPPQSFITEL